MQLKRYSRISDAPMWQKIVGFMASCLFCLLIIRCFFWYIDYDFKKKKDEILENPVFTKGVIINKSSYKGMGAKIEYSDNKKLHILNTGITTEFYEKHKAGDSVGVVYSKRKPSVSLLEYDLKPFIE